MPSNQGMPQTTEYCDITICGKISMSTIQVMSKNQPDSITKKIENTLVQNITKNKKSITWEEMRGLTWIFTEAD